jgi:aminoglycoside phosphotransferase (APT) family kinase protein
LLAAAFPDWATLPLARVEPDGTDNAIFRLGEDMVVRLPRIHWATEQPVTEQEWLPRLAPFLPLEIPTPLALGPPAESYPCHWSVCRWLEGEMATPERLDDPTRTADDLVGFLTALESIDPSEGPPPDGRGGPLAPRDVATRRAIGSLGDRVDAAAITSAWEVALAVPDRHDAVWIHGDLDARNLLAREGTLSGVLDWGSLAVGDRACDVMVAWKMVPAGLRGRFRDSLGVDGATWERARGWVLSQAVQAVAYYTPQTNPTLYHEASRWLEEALGDR